MTCHNANPWSPRFHREPRITVLERNRSQDPSDFSEQDRSIPAGERALLYESPKARECTHLMAHWIQMPVRISAC